MKTDPPRGDASSLIEAFCDQVWLQDGLAPASLDSYRQDLARFAAWLEARGSHLLCAQRADVESFLADEFRARSKATSIARRLSALRRFFALQLQQGTLDSDPTLRVRAPRLPRRLPKNLSEAQVEALLEVCTGDSAHAMRDKAMLETLYATGLRVSELVGLKLSQVGLDMGVVRVIGKGDKERLVPLGEEALAALRTYLREGRPQLAGSAKSDAVFLTARHTAMTRQAFWLLVKRYATRAGIPAGTLS
ncbi:MAG TPA: tyrosine-type recombinase/integrase, partial [Casimicrobiaceae bacterium]|nr:tyrosine-type recombinase/integrase [Casimicrobiaceae bacterium]